MLGWVLNTPLLKRINFGDSRETSGQPSRVHKDYRKVVANLGISFLRSFFSLFCFSFFKSYPVLKLLSCQYRSSHLEVFLIKGVLKICSKFTGEHTCRSVISVKLLCNFIEIALRHECSAVNWLHIFRTAFAKNTSGWLDMSKDVRKKGKHFRLK